MFFLGIAGPLIPYILFAGLLLSFSLGAIEQGSSSAEELQEKSIVLEKPTLASSANILENCYCLQYKTASPHQLDNQQTDLYCDSFQNRSSDNQKEFYSFSYTQNFYLSEFADSYFGLSPPLSLV